MVTKIAFAAFSLLILATGVAKADQPAGVTGQWLTEDKKGVVDIETCDGTKLCGKITWISKPTGDDGKPTLDLRNPDQAMHTRTICGLVTLGGFVPDDEPQHWTGGWIYNPEDGKTYKANMTLQPDGTLKLRGYVGVPMFGESQIWTRADNSRGTCKTG